MVIQVRNEAPFDEYPTAARARASAYRELEPRAIALPAGTSDQRRMVLHLLVLAMVVAAAVVGAFAS